MTCGACASTRGDTRAPPVARVDVDGAKTAIAAVLDDLHDAAAHADEPRYFGHFAPDGVFLGTDATERWDLAAFRAYAHPHFAAGKAWAFRATRRAIVVAPDGHLAWFDEDLATARLGPARGSGVLALVAGQWKIEQYNLAIVIPNDRFDAALAAMRAQPFDDRYQAAHARAIEAAKKGDFVEAESELRAIAELPDAVPGGHAVGLHAELAWLRWADGDLGSAYRELDAEQSAHLRSKLMGNMSVSTRVREQRDRAMIVRDMARTAPPPLRAETLATANRLRTEHDQAAANIGRHADVAVLEAFFAVRAGDAKGALAAARRVDTNDDKDAVDLYVLALAFDLAADHARAESLRALVRAERGVLMNLIVARRIDRDAAPARATNQ